tara:strand:+ start:23159 stop:23263 length:105 start_codon:yes stop_codon:yes gene_type:complete
MSDPEINKEQDAPDLEKVFTSLAGELPTPIHGLE